MTVSGESYECMGTGMVQLQLVTGVSVSMSALVVPSKPLDLGFILGMNGIAALQGVRTCSPNDVRFGITEVRLQQLQRLTHQTLITGILE